MNLIDGIDGLCSGMSALIVFAFSFWFLKNGYYAFSILGFIIIAAIIPFFVINVFCKKYKMFLGDNGSLFLGMVLSVFIIKFCESNIGHNTWLHFSNAPAVAFTLMAIPVLDTIRVFITRFINKKSPYRPDRTHLHHLFLDLFNKNHKKATFCILSIQLFYLILVFFGHNLSGEILIVISISSYLILYLSVYTLKVRKEKTKKAIETN
jgi:UDP-N-acetylmuramyl pentapeptide phosphotransferase/UDP-N-acetylglucosamine-1-phosphate transferase